MPQIERPAHRRTVLLESGHPDRCTAVVISRPHRYHGCTYCNPTIASLLRLSRAINRMAGTLIVVTPYGYFWWEPLDWAEKRRLP